MAQERRPLARRRRAAAEAGRDRSGKALFRLGAAAPARQLRALSAAEHDPIVAAFEELMEQEELTPDWLSLRHRLTFALRRLRGGSNRLSDIRVAIFGPAALTALARRSGELQPRAAEEIVLCRACRAKAVLRAASFLGAHRRPRHHRPAHLAQGPRRRAADSGQPLRAGRRSSLIRSSSRESRNAGVDYPLAGEGYRTDSGPPAAPSFETPAPRPSGEATARCRRKARCACFVLRAASGVSRPSAPMR